MANVAQATEFKQIDTGKSVLNFVYKQMGVGVEGRLQRFDAQLHFDPADLAASSVALDLDLTSLDAGSAEANDEIAGKDWFDIKSFPKATFVSNGFKTLADKRYEVSGIISIKGHTQKIAAPFVIKTQGDSTVFEGEFFLKRSDFAIGTGAWADFDVLANEVRIKFQFPVSTGK